MESFSLCLSVHVCLHLLRLLRVKRINSIILNYKKTLYPVLSAFAKRLAISLPMERFSFSISEYDGVLGILHDKSKVVYTLLILYFGNEI